MKTSTKSVEIPCVRCPFCKQTVTATIAGHTITCPNCKAKAVYHPKAANVCTDCV